MDQNTPGKNQAATVEEKIKARRERICNLLNGLGRKGTDRLLHYLNKNQFFTVPSSRHRHHNWRGGLAEHSLGVMEWALKRNANFESKDSIIAAALLHDICKTRQLYYDERGKLRKRNLHIKGHGYRSIKILEEIGFPITEDERLAIRWHMGRWPKDPEQRKDREKAEHCELWKIIYKADCKDASLKKPRRSPQKGRT